MVVAPLAKCQRKQIRGKGKRLPSSVSTSTADDQSKTVGGNPVFGLDVEKFGRDVRFYEVVVPVYLYRVGAESVVFGATVSVREDVQDHVVESVNGVVRDGEDLGLGASMGVVGVGKAEVNGFAGIEYGRAEVQFQVTRSAIDGVIGFGSSVADRLDPASVCGISMLPVFGGEPVAFETVPRCRRTHAHCNNVASGRMLEDRGDLAEVPVAYDDLGRVCVGGCMSQGVQELHDGIPCCPLRSGPFVPLYDGSAS
eukprot:9503789-Pyramimonas_sp.AAC.2